MEVDLNGEYFTMERTSAIRIKHTCVCLCGDCILIVYFLMVSLSFIIFKLYLIAYTIHACHFLRFSFFHSAASSVVSTDSDGSFPVSAESLVASDAFAAACKKQPSINFGFFLPGEPEESSQIQKIHGTKNASS